MASKKEEIIKFLRHIGDDCVPDGVDDDYDDFWIECKGQGPDDETCPDHGNCRICRFEYMKRKGWLNIPS